jgi:hypothetical protein
LAISLGNREGIDAWHAIAPRLRRSMGRKIAPVRAGSGAIEKNIEVHINRRFPAAAGPGPQLEPQWRRAPCPIALAPKPPQRLDPLVEQNGLKQN